MKYYIAYEGYNVVAVEANSKQAAEDRFWDEGLNDLANAEIREIQPETKAFQIYTDLNDLRRGL